MLTFSSSDDEKVEHRVKSVLKKVSGHNYEVKTVSLKKHNAPPGARIWKHIHEFEFEYVHV